MGCFQSLEDPRYFYAKLYIMFINDHHFISILSSLEHLPFWKKPVLSGSFISSISSPYHHLLYPWELAGLHLLPKENHRKPSASVSSSLEARVAATIVKKSIRMCQGKRVSSILPGMPRGPLLPEVHWAKAHEYPSMPSSQVSLLPSPGSLLVSPASPSTSFPASSELAMHLPPPD